MTDLSKTIEAKSDQLNSDDLLSGPITIRVTKVTGTQGDQPISIHYDGDNGKPWKPCKGMRRVLVALWGTRGDDYAGRALTLYRDGSVKWGGIEVGGIRISHMSHIESDTTLALTEKKGSKKPFTVRKLRDEPKRAETKQEPPTEPTKPRGDIASALSTIEKWSGDVAPLKKGLGDSSWTKEEKMQIAEAVKALELRQVEARTSNQ
jgi:hypothetical protein